MANAAAKWGIQNILAGSIDVDTDPLHFALIKTSATAFNANTFDSIADYGGGAIAGTSAPLTGVTVTGGTLDVADGNFGAVAATTECNRVALYTTALAGSAIIYNFDTFASGMPVTPNGGTISWTIAATGLLNFDA
jgi:hypothetical protein